MTDRILTITRAPKGTAREVVPLTQVQVPDLWHLAQDLPARKRDMVLETWYLAHDLLTELREHRCHDVPQINGALSADAH